MWGDVLGIVEVLFVYKECAENQPPYQTMRGECGGLYLNVLMERGRLDFVVVWLWAGRPHSSSSNF